MKKITLLISAIVLASLGAFAQRGSIQKSSILFPGAPITPSSRTCGVEDAMENLRNQDPAAFDANELLREQQIQNWLANNYDPNAKKAVITVPVVVQIWENTSTVPNSRVTQQMDRLNADFRRTNTDAGNTPAVFSAVDTEIQFCLATVDPNGNPTNGIVRRSTSTTPPQTGGTDMWDPTKYLNLYVYSIGGGVLGFATPNGMQAVHITTGAFGNTSGAYNLGRTATHEVGHHFNLLHIWGPGSGGCGTDDGVADTPLQTTSNGGCPSHPSASCSNGGDMFMNYMDYVNDACMNAFTAGQKARMNASLNTVRSGLLTSSATNCAAAGINADFTGNPLVINAGQTVTFTDASTSPATLNSWAWSFTSGTPASFNGQTPGAITYNTPGQFAVTLTVGDNASGSDVETKTAYVTVNATGTSNCDSTAANWDLATHGGTTGVSTWGAGNGYVLGANTYNDNGWADKITYSTTGMELTDVLYWFGVANGSGNLNLKVWGDAAGTPNSSNVMVQQSVSISSLVTTGNPTLWTLPSAAALNGNFYIGYDHSSLGNDTVATFSATTSASSVFSYNSGGTWDDISSFGANLSMAIMPIICNISTGEKEILGELANILIYPNPSVGTLNVALTEKINSTVTVLNMLGEVIATQTKNSQLFTFDINNHPNGVYFVRITSGDKVTTKKVLLTK